MSSILALDSGTSSVKAIIMRPKGLSWSLQSETTCAHAPPRTDSRASEQDAGTWWGAACSAIRGLGSEIGGVEAVGLSGQMQAVVLVGRDGQPLRPALLYSDCRAISEAAELETKFGIEHLKARTHNWKGAASVLPKLLWLQRHEPDIVAATSAVCLASHDFLYQCLTGKVVTDRTNASTTGLLDSNGTGWAVDLLLEAVSFPWR